MLFLPYRTQDITFLELWDAPDNAPAAAGIWLEYFSRAQIHALDRVEHPAIDDARFHLTRCDTDTPASLGATAAALPAPDIVIDDASHASHHQQDAFLTLFPVLKPGGLYIIEDLRSQPPDIERAGITTTATLFQSYLAKRSFAHSDPDTAARFNALANQISGCFLFQAQFRKRKRDQIAVIHKR